MKRNYHIQPIAANYCAGLSPPGTSRKKKPFYKYSIPTPDDMEL
ncbi:hypothetical protein [Filimonas lacunae]|nr:hypothetical protein [Filimonas lacunae]BAV04455.1 hypothetical protein FLA_0446 [Filimonas lacunae]